MKVQKANWIKTALLFMISSFLVFLIINSTNIEIKNVDSKGKRIVCFGDSITYGYGVLPGDSYPAVLSRITGIPVVNAGIDGDTSTEALRRLTLDVLSQDPFLVIIEFGGNDFLRKVPVDVTANNIKAMIETIQTRNAMVALVDISAGLLLKDYRPAFHKIAKEKGAIFIPSILSGIVTNPSMKSDFLHPNGNGYNLIAQRIYRAIIPYLKKNRLLRQEEI